MQDQHGTSAKETDITAVLVIVFALLVAATIAKVAGDFAKQQTSISTKAATSAKDACAVKFSKGEYQINWSLYSPVKMTFKDPSPKCPSSFSQSPGYALYEKSLWKCCLQETDYRLWTDNYCGNNASSVYDSDNNKLSTKPSMRCLSLRDTSIDKSTCSKDDRANTEEYTNVARIRVQGDNKKDDLPAYCPYFDPKTKSLLEKTLGVCCFK